MVEEKTQALTIREEEETALQKSKDKRLSFFKAVQYDLDDYSNIGFTEEQSKKMGQHLHKLTTGAVAIVPLICGGDICPFSKRCPLHAMGKSPVNLACLLEVQMLKYWICQYLEEYQVNPDNFTEVGYCNELAEIEIYLWRLNNNLAKPENASLIVNQPVGADRQGNPILQQDVSPFMEMKEKLYARKSKIIKLMVGDRQERYKKEAALKQREDKDSSSKQAEIRRKIEELTRRLDNNKKDSIKSTEVKHVLTPDAYLQGDDDE